MSPPDPRLRVLAALLARGRVVHVATSVLTLAAWGFGGVELQLLAGLVFAVATWLAVRVGLDADLFAAMADGTDPAAVDQGLVGLGLLSDPPERSLDDRIHGGRRLWRAQLACLIGQGTMAALAWGLA